MSGLEGLSAAAACLQLIELTAKIIAAVSDVYTKYRDGPASIRIQSAQLHVLADIAAEIKQNPSLQSNTAGTILQNCIRVLGDLLKVLQDLTVDGTSGALKKTWKAVDGLRQEKRILELLEELEREKSSLMLVIENANS